MFKPGVMQRVMCTCFLALGIVSAIFAGIDAAAARSRADTIILALCCVVAALLFWRSESTAISEQVKRARRIANERVRCAEERPMFRFICCQCGVTFGRAEIANSHSICADCLKNQALEMAEEQWVLG